LTLVLGRVRNSKCCWSLGWLLYDGKSY